MNAPAPYVVDKSTWDDGPWRDEPDRAAWWYDGVPCMAIRHPNHGTWNGYAAVTPGHPLYGVERNDPSPALVAVLEALRQQPVREMRYTFASGAAMIFGGVAPTPAIVLDVHGGVTFGDRGESLWGYAPPPGAPADLWWFGFDCSHAGDFSPGPMARLRELAPDLFAGPRYDHTAALAGDDDDWPSGITSIDGIYRTLTYVQLQTQLLAAQLAALRGGGGGA